jgi:protein TonB
MSRSAIIASLALHAGLLFLVGWSSPSTAARIGPGQSGADASIFADAAGGSFSTVPAAPSEPVTEPPIAKPDFRQPAPAMVLSSPPIRAFTAAPTQLSDGIAPPPEIPAVKLNVSSSKTGRTPHGVLARSTGNAGGRRGSGAGAEGGGGRDAHYVPPQFRIRYTPLYPEEARAQRLEGTVLLLVSIDTTGRVTSANVLHSCGHTVLDRAALAAVRSWLFHPARQDGMAIVAQVEVPVRFRFETHAS